MATNSWGILPVNFEVVFPLTDDSRSLSSNPLVSGRLPSGKLTLPLKNCQFMVDLPINLVTFHSDFSWPGGILNPIQRRFRPSDGEEVIALCGSMRHHASHAARLLVTCPFFWFQARFEPMFGVYWCSNDISTWNSDWKTKPTNESQWNYQTLPS